MYADHERPEGCVGDLPCQPVTDRPKVDGKVRWAHSLRCAEQMRDREVEAE